MRTMITATRVVLGGYLAAHGAQKLFGALNGPGLDAAGEHFENIGMSPGREHAALAGASELSGGVLTATGIAHPLGPLMLASTMSVATAAHRQGGPLAQNGGYELPLTNLAFAATLAALRPAGVQLSPSLPKRVTAGVAVGGAAVAGALIAKMVGADQTSAAESDPNAGDGDVGDTNDVADVADAARA